MNVFQFIEEYLINEDSTRQTGKTTALAEAAKKINGILIAASYDQALTYRSIHNVIADSFTSINLIGNKKPIILDHYTLCVIFRQLLQEHREVLLERNKAILDRDILKAIFIEDMTNPEQFKLFTLLEKWRK